MKYKSRISLGIVCFSLSIPLVIFNRKLPFPEDTILLLIGVVLFILGLKFTMEKPKTNCKPSDIHSSASGEVKE